MARKLWHIYRDAEPTSVELFLAFDTLLFGFWLLLPWSTFDASPNWRLLAQVVAEPVVGGLFLVVGTAKLLMVGHNYRRGQLVWLGGFALWLWIGLFHVLAAPFSAALPLYLPLAAASGWCYWRRSIQHTQRAIFYRLHSVHQVASGGGGGGKWT